MSERMKLFVYGNLLKGFSNHYYLENAKFLGETTTKPEYIMYDEGLDAYVTNGGFSSIWGEAYELSEDDLKKIDYLLNAPKSCKRVEVDLSDKSKAFMYLYKPEEIDESYLEIESGNWPEFLLSKTEEDEE